MDTQQEQALIKSAILVNIRIDGVEATVTKTAARQLLASGSPWIISEMIDGILYLEKI